MKNIPGISLILFLLTACTLPSNAPIQASVTQTFAPPTALSSATLTPPLSTETFTPIPPTETSAPTPAPFVESLKATVTADLLSCRYGPGAEYLYLYGLRKGANIELLGRADGNNWVLVKGKNLCWVNAKFIEIKGDPQTLKFMYPDGFTLHASPYYPPTKVLNATRDPNNRNKIVVEWMDIPLRAGDEEDESMQHYIIEVWRCEGGQIIFDPLATNYLAISFIDEPGCAAPSHGRVYVQEKHGFAGPADIPWPGL